MGGFAALEEQLVSFAIGCCFGQPENCRGAEHWLSRLSSVKEFGVTTTPVSLDIPSTALATI